MKTDYHRNRLLVVCLALFAAIAMVAALPGLVVAEEEGQEQEQPSQNQQEEQQNDPTSNPQGENDQQGDGQQGNVQQQGDDNQQGNVQQQGDDNQQKNGQNGVEEQDDSVYNILTITKKVAEDSKATEFTFKLELTEKDAEAPTWKYRIGTEDEFVDPSTGGTFVLKDGQTATIQITRDPSVYQIEYEVTEEMTDNWWNDSPANANGQLSLNPTEVTFTNTFVTITTTATVNGAKEVTASSTPVTVKDEVKATNLPKNIDFTVYGELVVADTEEVVANADATLTPTDDEWSATLEYKDVNTKKYGGKKLVSRVAVQNTKETDPTYVFKHVDLTDTNQTITVNPAGPGTLIVSKTVETPKNDEALLEAEKNSNTSQIERLTKRIERLKGIEFAFTITLTDQDDKPLTGEYKYSGSKEGSIKNNGSNCSGIVMLKSGEYIKFDKNLPDGTKYKVVESKIDNWTTTKAVDDATATSGNECEGSITGEKESKAAFTNTPVGYFVLSKSIADANTDELKATEFTFTITFLESKPDENNTNPKQLEGEFSYVGFSQGKIKSGGTVKLKGGESITFTNLPVGIYIRAAETPVDGWTTPHTVLSGTTVEGVPLTASFTNTYKGSSNNNSNKNNSSTTKSGTTTSKSGTTTTSKTSTPKTGDDTNFLVPIIICVVAAGLVALGLIRRKRMK